MKFHLQTLAMCLACSHNSRCCTGSGKWVWFAGRNSWRLNLNNYAGNAMSKSKARLLLNLSIVFALTRVRNTRVGVKEVPGLVIIKTTEVQT